MFKEFLKSLRIDSGNPALLRAQFGAFTKQVPLLYLILSINAVALAFAYRDLAPAYLTFGVSTALVSLCAFRLVVWRRSRNAPLSDTAVAKRLKGMVAIGAAMGVGFLSWALALFPYGHDRAQDQVTFFVAITVVSCIFCLMHLRAAALVLTTIVIVPFTGFLLATGDVNLVSIGLNLVLVAVAMVYILLVASRDFVRLVKSELEAKRLSEDNERLANIDALTGLPNRREFFAALNRALDKRRDGSTPLAVGVLDLDGFKPVNDRFGHVVGDHLLTEAGARLRGLSGPTRFVARLGGDEFGMIIEGDEAGEAALLAFGEEACAALKVPFEVLGVVANVSVSIGFAPFPDAGQSAAVLYEHADYALYHAKNHQRGRPVVFTSDHATEIRDNTVADQCLRNADLETEMSLHFQPLYDVVADRLVAFEALARWDSPELGRVNPAIFIPIAERSELINRITQCLLRKALKAASAWPEDVRISFNLSARDIVSPEAMLQIVSIIEQSPVAPHRIDLEVTETSIVADFEQARTSLTMLKALGVKIALDDFGTGHSSLSHVHRLPLDKIKVDRSFVADIETQLSQRLVASVLDLCENLDIDCVIEGAETADQAQILRKLGCATMQGYHFGRPVPEQQVAALLASRSRAAPAGARARHSA